MKPVIKLSILTYLLLFLSCSKEEPPSPSGPPYSAASLLSLTLENDGTFYTAAISGREVSLPSPLPDGTQEVSIKALQISTNATADVSAGDVLQVSDSPISITVTAENGTTTRRYELQLGTARASYDFSTNNHFILSNGVELDIKGVVYTPNYPGNYPWDIERNTNLPAAYENSIRKDIMDIKAMGANTIRLWSAPKTTR